MEGRGLNNFIPILHHKYFALTSRKWMIWALTKECLRLDSQAINIYWSTDCYNHGISELSRMPEVIEPNQVRDITEGMAGNTKQHQAQSWFWGNFYWKNIQIHTCKRLQTVGGREKGQIGKSYESFKEWEETVMRTAGWALTD